MYMYNSRTYERSKVEVRTGYVIAEDSIKEIIYGQPSYSSHYIEFVRSLTKRKEYGYNWYHNIYYNK